MHAKTAKDLLLREIRRLQRKNENLEGQHNALAEKHAWVEQVIETFKNDTQCTEVINRLKHGDSPQSIAQWLGRPITKYSAPSLPSSEEDLAVAIEKYHQELVDNGDSRYWTSTTDDPALIEHLVTLYLTWVHPFHMLFDENQFMISFRSCSDNYCSAALVNAVCAMSCHLLGSAPDSDGQTMGAIKGLKTRFFDEARTLLRHTHIEKMTSIQTLSVLFLFELGSGTGQMAGAHLRLASEALVAKQENEQSEEANSIAFWGVLTVYTAWSALLYMKPTIPISPKHHVFKGIAIDDPDIAWRAYRQPGDSSKMARRGYTMLASSQLAKLLRVVHEGILLYFGAYGSVTGGGVFQIWERYTEWEDELPQVFRELDSISDPLPYVLALHIQYHTALINLFEPLLYLETTNSTRDAIADQLIMHAKAGLALVVSYRQRYSAAYLTPVQLFCTVHICDAIVSHDRTGQSRQETIRFCIETLAEAKASYTLAGPLQRMFASSLSELDIPLTDDLKNLIGPPPTYQLDEFLNACTRPTYRVPIGQMLPTLKPTLAQDFMDEWQRTRDQGNQNTEMGFDGSGIGNDDRQRSMHISSLLNHD